MSPKPSIFQRAIARFHPPLVAWPAWQRLLALAPFVACLWIGVAWALGASS